MIFKFKAGELLAALLLVLSGERAIAMTKGSVSTGTVVKTAIRFPIELEISHQAQYSLLDLVEVENPRESVLRQLSRAEIPSKWTQGSRWRLSSSQILSLLRQARVSQGGVEIFVPNSVQPKKSKDILSSVHLKRVIGMVAKSECRLCEFKIDLHHIPKVLLSNWEWDPLSVKFRGSFTTLIKMPDAKWTGWLTGNVQWKGPVWLSQRAIGYQEKIRAADLVESFRDITFAKDLIRDRDELVGQVAARTLASMSPLSRSDFRKEAVIKKGQLVKALIGEDEFEVSVNSIAEEPGFVGEVIKVKNIETLKPLSATVIDQGLVRVK